MTMADLIQATPTMVTPETAGIQETMAESDADVAAKIT